MSRVGKIGASQIAGLIKEYAPNLLQAEKISQETYDKLVAMPTYLETKYSLAHKLSFNEEKLEAFQKFIYNAAMERGHACEEMVKDDYLSENPHCKEISSQQRIERTLKGVDIPLITTLDYLVADSRVGVSILECKTTDISRLEFISECPYNYYIQLQMQMLFSDIHQGSIHIGGIQTISEKRGKEKTYQLLGNKTFGAYLEPEIADAIKTSVAWLDYELKNNKDEILAKPENEKTKADLEIDAFLEDYAETVQVTADGELSQKIIRLEELKQLEKEKKKLEEEVKIELKQQMNGGRKIRVSGNNFELIASYTKPTFHDEISIKEKTEKAKKDLMEAESIQIGDAKSSPSLRMEILSI